MSANSKVYLSKDVIDKVIYSDSVTYPGTLGTAYTVNTGVGDYGYVIGVFSIDGGSTWNDLFGVGPVLSLGSSYVYVSADDSVSGVVTFATGGIGSPTTPPSISIKYVVLVNDSPSTITKQSYSYTGNAAAYASGSVAYRNIVFSSTVSGLTDSALRTVAHNQGIVPLVAPYSLGYNSSGVTPFKNYITLSGGVLGGYYFVTDATNVYIRSGPASYSSAYWRIYKTSD